MNWYLAKIVFKISSPKIATLAQFDEQLTLIEANTSEEALLKSRVYGLKEEAKSLADATLLCKWEFVNVAELTMIPGFRDGAELYSQIHETSEGHSYIDYVHHKAAALQLKLA
jgi:hypothetical protein